MQQAKSFPHFLEQAEIRRFHAMMLIDRAAPSDRSKAQTLLRQALEGYSDIGMPRHIEMTQTLLPKARGCLHAASHRGRIPKCSMIARTRIGSPRSFHVTPRTGRTDNSWAKSTRILSAKFSEPMLE